MRITIKLWKIDGKVKVYNSYKIRRIIIKIKADKVRKAYLKVFYGKASTNSGRIEEITNSGTYDSKNELLQVLSEFTDKSLLEDTNNWINSFSKLHSHNAILTNSTRD